VSPGEHAPPAISSSGGADVPDSLVATRRFSKGETMPRLAMNNPRLIRGLDWLPGMRTCTSNGAWTLAAYLDLA
jgi:hypothetical protein